jgi:hypothetical protein
MERPTIHISRESRGERTIYNLSLQGGVDHGATVLQELTAVAVKHGLAADGGGCYMVQAMPLGGGSVSFLGGMYVPPQKRDGVVSELRSLGYKITESAA